MHVLGIPELWREYIHQHLDRKQNNSSDIYHEAKIYYIHINDTTFELSVFWPSDTEKRINELRFSDSVSLSFKTRLTSVSIFAATLRKVNFKHGNRDRKHDDVMSRNVW